MVERNYSIDILKIISACFVVFIHIQFPGTVGGIANCMARFAVPIFFAISGYFCYGASADKIKKRLFYIIKVAVFANLIYFIWNCYCAYVIDNDGIGDYIIENFEYREIARWIFMEEGLFSGHLWYLSSLIIMYMIIYTYIKFYEKSARVSYNIMYIVALIGFMINVIFSVKEIGIGTEDEYFLYRNSLFFGMPMFMMGLGLHEYKKIII